MSRMLVIVLGACLIVATTVSGCGPQLSKKDLGEVQTDVRKLPGAGEKYELPAPHPSDQEQSRDDDV